MIRRPPRSPLFPSPPLSRSPEPPPAPERGTAERLTITKVIAKAGAAATAAVAGSYFGAQGTVAGAAVAAVVTTVSSTTYQRSLDRTRYTVHSRLQRSRDREIEATDILPAAHVSAEAPAARKRPRRP